MSTLFDITVLLETSALCVTYSLGAGQALTEALIPFIPTLRFVVIHLSIRQVYISLLSLSIHEGLKIVGLVLYCSCIKS